MKVLVVFNYEKDGKTGFNNATFAAKESVPSEEELIKVKKGIKKFGQYDNVVIMNWIPLKG